MAEEDRIDEPSPTIVGPQPSGRGTGRRLSIPRGLERLVALAGISPEWKADVLAGPLAAAREAGLELSESERAVIESVPREALEGMIESFGKSAAPERPKLTKSAALAALAAILAGGLSGCDFLDTILGQTTMGIMPDEPPPKQQEEPASNQQSGSDRQTQDIRPDTSMPPVDGIRPDEPRPKIIDRMMVQPDGEGGKDAGRMMVQPDGEGGEDTGPEKDRMLFGPEHEGDAPRGIRPDEPRERSKGIRPDEPPEPSYGSRPDEPGRRGR